MSLRNDLNEYNKDKPLIVIAGATATGKTKAAVETAKLIGGEVVSADSMQIYKYMDIGTAKPTIKEMDGIPHYMIDELYPDEVFNVAVFKEMADNYISMIRGKGKIPVIAGGTGFYINALMRGTDFKEGGADQTLREYYQDMANKRGNAWAHNELKEIDPAAAASIHVNNVKRVIRAIEYFKTTGRSITVHNSDEKSKPINKGVQLYILDMDRASLYDKINRRVDIMIEKGLIGEVKALLEMGYNENLVSMQAIGYKEVVSYFKGECTMDYAVERIKKNSRNYAKRQVTWFKHQTDGVIISAGEAEDFIRKIWHKR